MHAGKLGQVTNVTIVGGTATHCVEKIMDLFRYCSLEGDITMPGGALASPQLRLEIKVISFISLAGGLHAKLCHAFPVLN